MPNKSGVLVMQSGGSTPVINRSLLGIVREVEQSQRFGEIYGAIHALDGLLDGCFINLAGRSKSWWEKTASTPGAILGSSRRSLNIPDVQTALDALLNLKIRYVFIIGGNDSAETGLKLHSASISAGIQLTTINVPKTIDNDLVLTDHSPGYGSAARFVALATMGAGRDAETMGKAAPITVIEVMGRDAGWLAASAALAKHDDIDAPHVICVPEVPIEENRFLDLVEDAYRQYGFSVAVVAENTRGEHGVLGGEQQPVHIDDFGHRYYEGAGKYLSNAIACRLKIRTRYERPGTIQRSMIECVSKIDAQEAEMAGRAAVQAAINGSAGQMIILVRQTSNPYNCTTDLAPLEQVAGKVQRLPPHYYDSKLYMPTQQFMQYAHPLIGTSLPTFTRLDEHETTNQMNS